jgi:hypothetical protein
MLTIGQHYREAKQYIISIKRSSAVYKGLNAVNGDAYLHIWTHCLLSNSMFQDHSQKLRHQLRGHNSNRTHLSADARHTTQPYTTTAGSGPQEQGGRDNTPLLLLRCCFALHGTLMGERRTRQHAAAASAASPSMAPYRRKEDETTCRFHRFDTNQGSKML